MKRLRQATKYLQQRNLLSEELAPWFTYGLCRVFLSGVSYCVLLLLGWCICGVAATVSFLLGFVLLRQYSGGWHASTPFKCLCCSVVQLIICLGMLYPLFLPVTYVAAFSLVAASAITVLAFAPLLPPQMHASQEEFILLRKLSHKMLWAESLVVCLLAAFRLENLALSVSLGIGCAACSLWIAKRMNKKTEE